MYTYTPTNNVFDNAITNLLSTLSILIEIIFCAHAKGEKALMISDLVHLLVVFRVTARRSWQ